jgi:hypothetical protein
VYWLTMTHPSSQLNSSNKENSPVHFSKEWVTQWYFPVLIIFFSICINKADHFLSWIL